MNPPILFIIFNRPESTQKVFAEIKKAKPTKLFIAADGPRKNNKEDERLCTETRNMVKDINWPCEIKTLFRKENLGCKYAVSSAIDWFFSEVEEGIILEDDCMPHPDFLSYCAYMLKKYRHTTKIMMINGTNLLSEKAPVSNDYYFSNYIAIWGWATWRRAWELYDVELKKFDDDKITTIIHRLYKNNQEIQNHYKYLWNLILTKHIDTWDIQWVYCCLIHEGIAISPTYNLVANIGIEGVHTPAVGPLHNLPVYPFSHTIHGPAQITIAHHVDEIIYNRVIASSTNSLSRKFQNKLSSAFRFLSRRLQKQRE